MSASIVAYNNSSLSLTSQEITEIPDEKNFEPNSKRVLLNNLRNLPSNQSISKNIDRYANMSQMNRNPLIKNKGKINDDWSQDLKPSLKFSNMIEEDQNDTVKHNRYRSQGSIRKSIFDFNRGVMLQNTNASSTQGVTSQLYTKQSEQQLNTFSNSFKSSNKLLFQPRNSKEYTSGAFKYLGKTSFLNNSIGKVEETSEHPGTIKIQNIKNSESNQQLIQNQFYDDTEKINLIIEEEKSYDSSEGDQLEFKNQVVKVQEEEIKNDSYLKFKQPLEEQEEDYKKKYTYQNLIGQNNLLSLIEEVSPTSQIKEDSSWDDIRIKQIMKRKANIKQQLSHGLSLKKENSEKLYTIQSKDVEMDIQSNTIVLYVNGLNDQPYISKQSLSQDKGGGRVQSYNSAFFEDDQDLDQSKYSNRINQRKLSQFSTKKKVISVMKKLKVSMRNGAQSKKRVLKTQANVRLHNNIQQYL
ncbi:UNKNOWN [Stylonychia lemnae]|uniref:Uncharacterized protein n=1 Tax=Stylonychia lemnae TaxID=5949 RepID=A0A078A8K7_STYLE|nr:UNKNOWN [Stylonychia lemnae]|eukprot:CDW78559.1 UNKNOWN [Stylonychia lemnae]